MLLSTTDVQDLEVQEYIGVVTGCSVRGSAFHRDLVARLKDFFGGSVGSYEKDLALAEKEALGKMVNNAKEAGADAVIGISLSVQTLPAKDGGFFLAVATGTAVRKRRE
jgi:uncharacterized protein YbjQ (UPF0145 family)